MKNILTPTKRRLALAAVTALVCVPALAQKVKVSGVVTDASSGETLVGASIRVAGTTAVASTDNNGKFTIEIPSGSKKITVYCIGYVKQEVAVDGGAVTIGLEPTTTSLGDAVVIGYGTVRKSDLTGSVSTVRAKDFNKGVVSSAEQLINGKVSGVQIMSNSGSASGGSTIRIRGGASLNASNDPLIVLDGVPLENGGISGNSSNFLSMINPSDIESMTVLKDASSTAIYGSRASNGVIIITTKKGATGKPRVNFTTTHSLSTRTGLPDMMSTSEFINTINQNGTAAQKAMLGSASTDWNDEVYRPAYGTDNNLSVTGAVGEWLPFRASVGYYNQNGIVRGDQVQRVTAGLVLTPSFLDDHLKFTVNAKGTYNKNAFYASGAIWGAATYNPTLPVYSGTDAYNGYTEATDDAGLPPTSAQANPRGLVDQYDAQSKVGRFIGSMDVDYKVHGLPELKLHATLGADVAKGKGTVYVPYTAYQEFSSGGSNYAYGPQKNVNRLLTLYANYNKYVEAIKSNIDATIGYDYQHWKSTTPSYAYYSDALYDADGNKVTTGGSRKQTGTEAASDYRHTLLSYYGRINYSLMSRYLLTATVRRDASSRFSKDTRWGTFPSVALGWTVTEEEFLKHQSVLNNLKIRASYGVTGQQEGIGNYKYLPIYTQSVTGSQMLWNGQYIYTYRPEAYVSDLKWETTTSWDFGFDFSLFNSRLSGSFDYYTRQTKDLLATVPSAAGTNFAKTILTNVGNVDSKGIEFTINATPIKTDNWQWDLSYNFTWQKMKVKNLSLVEGGEQTNVLVGPYAGSDQIQVLTEGCEPYMFYVYHQLYDEQTGKPIEGAYADLNGDGVINSDDRYRYHSRAPKYIMSLSSSLRWKKLTLGLSFRANIGNYVYNGMAMNTGAWETVDYGQSQLNNLNRSYLKTGFQTRQYLSDYYVENGSFLKLDNINLSYDFGQVTQWMSLSLSASVQNVFCITKYTGGDPEQTDGMENSFYPRPRTYSVSLAFQF